MITYNEETQTLEITEFISWEHCVKQVYQDEYAFRKNDAETCDPPEPCYVPAPDELTDEQIDEIMEFILDRYEFESECGDRCGYGVSLDDDFVRKCVTDWCSDYDEYQRP